ncbi:DUF5919 domain-containing protein [Nonomuraea cavernae]|uniref:DUF5919 domain-containing protein n=1 Tax=Nonomuraea cavernae TaxID=2045107 RepID=A0A918DH81_9ACTN|nr:DUF5919 domain-containing protein [Nonomuraea cavernae]MCA2185298.1 DUF5919 domain-containing protein [Nonomuraea cavernae]GGO66036.1 hypothetical protein GCM10012289_19080 [Nonomuraea cavernae]
MRLLARLRADLSTGKNLEIYLTALIALVVGVLGVFDVVDTKVVGAATLATLALLAVNALGPRHHVAELESRIMRLNELVEKRIAGEVAADAFLATTRQGLEQRIVRADDIRIAGVTLNRTIRNHVGELENRLRRGASIKVLLIDPDGTAPLEAARRSTIPDRPEVFEHRIKSTIDLLRHLAGTPDVPGRIEVRFMSFVPAFGLVLIDVDSDDGIIDVELGTHRSPGPDPVFTLRARHDHRWYQHFHAEFERMWQVSRPASATDGFATSGDKFSEV